DGIRDRNVTGVQTCALPICSAACCIAEQKLLHHARRNWVDCLKRFVEDEDFRIMQNCAGKQNLLSHTGGIVPDVFRRSIGKPKRSEERRVGKGGGCRESRKR